MARKNDKRTYTKKLVTWIILNATIWVYMTYVLALMGREEIAETLSGEVVTVIIGTVLTYAVKALFENIFKYRSKNNIKESEDDDL